MIENEDNERWRKIDQGINESTEEVESVIIGEETPKSNLVTTRNR